MNTNNELSRDATCKAIYDLGQEHGINRLEIIKSIERGESYTDFQKTVLATISKRIQSERASFSQFSLVEFILSKASQKPQSKSNEVVLAEYGKPEGVIPTSALRTLTTAVDADGGITVDSELQELITPLDSGTPLQKLCSHVESQSNFTVPVKTTVSEASWESETGIPNQAQITFSEKKISGFYMRALTHFSKTLLNQSSIDVENLIRADLRQAINLTVESALINSDGDSGRAPVGLVHNPNIQTITHPQNVINYDHILELEEKLLDGNVAVNGSELNADLMQIENDEYSKITLAFLVGNGARRIMKKTPQFAGSEIPLFESGNFSNDYLEIKRDGTKRRPQVLGRKAISSNYAPSQSVFFGDFSELVIAKFQDLEILVDPFTLSTRNLIRVSVHANLSWYLRHDQAIVHLRQT